MISYELKFLTSADAVEINTIDLKASKYESKKKHNDSVYDVAKKSYLERRGGRTRALKPRLLKELESKLRDRSVVHCEWSSETLVTIVFATGAIAYVSINANSLDITQILFDRYCVGKLAGHTITGVVLSKTHLLFTHAECSATLITFGVTKNGPNSILCKIADRNPHVQIIELADGLRRAERRVSWSEAGGAGGAGRAPRALVWTAAGAEPAPWSPAQDVRANLHLYQLNRSQMNVIAYHQLQNETLLAEISRDNYNVIHIVDQTTCQKSGVYLDWVRYEIADSEEGVVRLSPHRSGATRAALPAAGRAAARAARDPRLLVACIDASVHVVHHVAGVTHSTRASFIPSVLCWSGGGGAVACAEEAARLQCFDGALQLLHHNASCIHLQNYASESAHMNILATRSVETGAVMLTTLGGARALALLRLTYPNIPLSWIRANRLPRAVAALQALDWAAQGAECLRLLQRIAGEVFRRPLNASSEACLQAALGSYLGAAAAPARRRAAVTDLARKFFHHLLRRGRLDKAMSLAVDLGAWDVFGDARWAAARAGRAALAAEAAAAAGAAWGRDHDRTESECSSSCSCSSHSSSDSAPPPPPPPLPRLPLPLPPPPSLCTVPILQHEASSTNSIRPNLHQYLERDLTIWNTEVREERPVRWHSMDDVLSDNQNMSRHRSLSTIDEQTQIKNYEKPKLYQRELRDDTPLYRYQVAYPTVTVSDRLKGMADRRQEKNVKFSDTVTINVVSEPPPGPVPSRELADSLPLCAPHAYLAAFEPAPATPAAPSTPATPAATGTHCDYVEV